MATPETTSEAFAITEKRRMLGVGAVAEISDLTGSIQRLVSNEEQGDITAILLLARRIEALTGPLIAILEGQELLDNEAEAIGYDAEAAA